MRRYRFVDVSITTCTERRLVPVYAISSSGIVMFVSDPVLLYIVVDNGTLGDVGSQHARHNRGRQHCLAIIFLR